LRSTTGRPAIAAPELRDDLLTLRSKFPPQSDSKRIASLTYRKTKISGGSRRLCCIRACRTGISRG